MRRLRDGLCGAEDRLDLHLVDLRVEDPEAAAAGAEHRVLLGDLLDAREHALEVSELGALLDLRALDLGGELGEVRQELVQRRIEQPDRDRQPGHRVEQSLEVLLLQRQQLGQRVAP